MLVLQVQEFNKNSYTFESKGQKLILFRSICYSSGVFVYVRSNILYLVVIKEDHLNRVHGVPFQLILMQTYDILTSYLVSLEMPVPSQAHYGFHSFPVVD